MATSTMIKLLTILFLLFISLHPQNAFATEDEDDDDIYIIDSPFGSTHRLRSRFLSSVKKGTHCDPNHNTVCNGVSANNGKGYLKCCKKHCRDVSNDKNNCGECGHKCGKDQSCCGGSCVRTHKSPHHCGKCHDACAPGVKCENGACGYA